MQTGTMPFGHFGVVVRIQSASARPAVTIAIEKTANAHPVRDMESPPPAAEAPARAMPPPIFAETGSDRLSPLTFASWCGRSMWSMTAIVAEDHDDLADGEFRNRDPGRRRRRLRFGVGGSLPPDPEVEQRGRERDRGADAGQLADQRRQPERANALVGGEEERRVTDHG